MHDWIKRQTGCHKRLRCCQDSIHKTKSRAGRVPGVKTRDTLGMDHHLAAVSDLHARLLEKEKNTNSVTGLPKDLGYTIW